MSVSNNALFAYNEQCQFGSVYDQSLAITESAYPLSNVLLPDLYNPVKFMSTTAVIQFTVDLGSQQAMNLIAMLKHNLNNVARWRVYLNADIVAGPLGNEYDSGWISAIPALPGFGSLAWGQFYWGDVVPEFNLSTYNRHAYAILPTTVVARYVTIAIDAPANTDEIRFFRLWASIGYQPSVNVQYGAQVIPIDDTKVTKSASGVRNYGDRVQRRMIVGGFDFLPRSEMLYNIVGGLYLASGISIPMIIILEPNDPSNFYTQAVYGNLQKIDGATHVSWLRMATSFQLEEQP